MPEQICSGIFYNRFLSVSIVKILYKAEAKNPEAKVRENITLDIKDNTALKRSRQHRPTSHCLTLPCSRLHTTRHSTAWHDFARQCTARHYLAWLTLPDITLSDITLHGVTLAEITLPCIFSTTLYYLALLVEKLRYFRSGWIFINWRNCLRDKFHVGLWAT